MKNFAVIPVETVRDEKLKASEKLIYIYLMTLAGESCNCFPSINTISRELSLSKKTVSETIKTLQDKKCIIYARRKGKKDQHLLNYYLVANRCFESYSDELQDWKELYLSGLINHPGAVIINSGDCNAQNQGSDNC